MFGLLGVVPGVGDAASAAESADLFNRGENFAGSMAALGALPFVPAMGGIVKKTGLLGDNVKTLQEQLRQVEAKYEFLRKKGLYSDDEWDAIGKEATPIRKQLMEMTGDPYGNVKVKIKRPSDNLLNGVYATPNDVPKSVKQWVQQNSNLLTSDATDAVRWGRIAGTLKDERYANEPITLYRAVADGDEIRPGDWVTTSLEYAQDHLRKSLGGKGTILEETVNGSDVLVSPTGNAEEAIFAPIRFSK
jgi:hypothetical protein